jgi:uncharacterized protein YfaT (DUF1175 family)
MTLLRKYLLDIIAGVVLLVLIGVGIVWWQGWLLQPRLISVFLEDSPHLGSGFECDSNQFCNLLMPRPPTPLDATADGITRRFIEFQWNGFGHQDWRKIKISAKGMHAELVPPSGPTDKNAEVDISYPINPGDAQLQIQWPNFPHPRLSTFHLHFDLDDSDNFSDGTPDFLRLHTAEDRRAFRAWFTVMADALYDLDPAKLPAGVTDCSGLLRYAYREALLQHDDHWFADRRAQGILTVMPPLPTIAQYHYPDTPLGAALFRVRPGNFSAADLTDGSFAQFADAKSLMMWNTHFISRDIHMARPGDVIFYRQLVQNSPYHSMVITSNDPGASMGAAATLVVYHTGPVGRTPGEVRKMTIDDLLHHPDARWRPEPTNPNFMGVYRWNILREDD